MAYVPYFQKLQDVRWQKKRVRILARDDWTCQECGAKDETVHVHHGYYERGRDPWEYPDESLRTLCKSCHKRFHDTKLVLDKLLSNLTCDSLLQVIGYCRAMESDPKSNFCIKIENFEDACGIADYFRINTFTIISESEITRDDVRKFQSEEREAIALAHSQNP